jgi:triosephosphate isomerase (TIM)
VAESGSSSGPAKAKKRRPLISGNWKMHLNHFEAIQTVQKLYWALKPDDYRAAEISIHPPFTDLRSVQTVLEADSIPIALGAQNCHFDETGAYTGEISPVFLAKLNVAYVIVGHSERRQMFHETDEIIAKKVASVVRHGMTPILCVGESVEQRESGNAEECVLNQLRQGFSLIKKEEVARSAIAYEPIWAVGTGHACPPDVAQGMCKLLRGIVAEQFGGEVAEQIRIQYGGSVRAANARELFEQADIDGALVGSASLEPDEFAHIVTAVRG